LFLIAAKSYPSSDIYSFPPTTRVTNFEKRGVFFYHSRARCSGV